VPASGARSRRVANGDEVEDATESEIWGRLRAAAPGTLTTPFPPANPILQWASSGVIAKTNRAADCLADAIKGPNNFR